MIKALIFDLDGTLADTIESIRAAVNNTMRHFGFPEKSYLDVREGIGGGTHNLICAILPADRVGEQKLTAEVLNYYNAEYSKTFLMADRCYPGMYESVMTLIERGYLVAILSNKPDRFVRELAVLLFPEGGISFAAGQAGLPLKPDPTSALMVAKQLNTAPDECVFIGDSDVDILTAKNAGMRSVGCSWGYRGADVLRASGADIIIDRPEELLSLFKEI